jgi:hypothetical protein
MFFRAFFSRFHRRFRQSANGATARRFAKRVTVYISAGCNRGLREAAMSRGIGAVFHESPKPALASMS